MRAPTSKWEVMEVPGVATNYTAHLFSMQAKYFVGEKKETRSMRRLVAALVPCCPCGSGAKERLFFLYACAPSVAVSPGAGGNPAVGHGGGFTWRGGEASRGLGGRRPVV